MFALDVANKQIIKWNYRAHIEINVASDLLEKIILEPEKEYQILKEYRNTGTDCFGNEKSIKLYNDSLSLYVVPNENGSVNKMAFRYVKENYGGYILSREEDLLLCNYKLLYSAYRLLDDQFYGEKDEHKIDFILEGMGKVWEDILNAKVTE